MSSKRPETIPENAWNYLTPVTQEALLNLTESQQKLYATEYTQRAKSDLYAILAWFAFGMHYIYFNKVGTQIAFWIVAIMSAGIIGFIWWIVDIFRIFDMTIERNREISKEIISEIKNIN